MPEIDFRKLCVQFREKLDEAFIEGIERRLGQDFDEALEKRPKDLLISILQNVHLYYVSPYEMTIELSKYLSETYHILNFSLAFSERYEYPIGEKIEEAAKLVNAFYEMIEAIGLSEFFAKEGKKWW